ncbi:MAG: hypothetical protein RIS76_1235 [Verrucomicrobiota bacterium]
MSFLGWRDVTTSPRSTPPVDPLAARLPFYFGWVQVGVAAMAMVATLPGRTQGLGLITESLLRDLSLDRSGFAQINFWGTLLGSLACVGFGGLVDRFGSRVLLTVVSAALGGVVLGMSRVDTMMALAVAVTLTRALGQSALSVASLTITPQWFSRRLPMAMAVYTAALSMGFMVAFPAVGAAVQHWGWRMAWQAIGWILMLIVAPMAWLLARRSPESCGLTGEPGVLASTSAEATSPEDCTLGDALRSPLFWVFALGSTLYGLVASGIGLFNESILRERGFTAHDYYNALIVTAMTGLLGNFLGGWLTEYLGPRRLMAAAMGLLATGLVCLPVLESQVGLMSQASLMGIAGGVVAVLFFTIWRQAFGRLHLGRIQGAAQLLTVAGSATGPLLLAKVVESTGSYALAFRGLSAVVALLGVAALRVGWPTRKETTAVIAGNGVTTDRAGEGR